MLSSDVRGIMITKRQAASFGLLCPAQGYPIPNFSIRASIATKFSIILTKMLFLHWFLSTEPVGFKAPTFSSSALSSMFRKKSGLGFALLCDAQAYPVPFFRLTLHHCSEPVGFKAPTFSSVSDIIRFKKPGGESFALLCEAQAYPVPHFRTGWIQVSQFCIGSHHQGSEIGRIPFRSPL
ncbi:hypothetical protein M8J75_003371 [Diaphorina citri]|nr:hypothetical protein M8J75_003371 [Diaphorina citri]